MDEVRERLTIELDADPSKLQSSIRESEKLAKSFASTMSTAFADVAVRGRKLEDVIKSIGLKLSEMVVSAAFKPFESVLSSGFTSLLSSLPGFAKGGVPGRQMPVPFAQGGVVAAPTAFQFGGGQLGIMGEQGAEAILPLARGADGRLGVRGGGGGAVQVTFNVSATDAQSFQRSEAQIGAMLSRVIARGDRNL